VADLKGKSLNLSVNPRAALSRIWLEVLCRQHGLGPAGQALAKITPAAKSTQAVLPVFFGKTDACITTRASWEVMCEMNPQLLKQLRVLATSPSLVPSLTCFRSGFSDAFKKQIAEAVVISSSKTSFKQLLELFKSDGIVCRPITVLESTRALEAAYYQLCVGTNDTKAITMETIQTAVETERGGM
jgi:phosphonate transport system substrate-binding protein